MVDLNIVIKFWEWFKVVSDDLLLDPTNQILIEQLDNQVQEIGGFDWEIGPINNGMYYLAISPNLDSALLEETHRIINLAPECKGWLFLPAKPPKEWEGIWEMNNQSGKRIRIDASKWQYILYKYEDGTFDMDAIISGVDGDLATCYLALDIAITGYVGEEKYLRQIKNVRIVSEFDEEVKNNSTLFKYIGRQIA